MSSEEAARLFNKARAFDLDTRSLLGCGLTLCAALLGETPVKRVEADLITKDLKVAVVATRWNHFIVDRLVEGTRTAFVQHGGDDDKLELFIAPGSFELPLVAQRLAATEKYDAIVCLGAVIRGATDHYDFVAGGASSSLARLNLDAGVPVAFGILTTDTIEQAIERAGTKAGNKGVEALLAAVETANLLRKIDALEQSEQEVD